MALIGIDIGGTKICVCVGDKSGKIFLSKRIETQPLGGSKRGLNAIKDLIIELLKEANKELSDIKGIGISSPGPISTKNGMMLNPPNLPGWENAKLVDFFSKAFHKPIELNNDANAAALAEFRFGHHRGARNLVYLTCSTGMGGGAIANGTLVQGASDTAAEVGHFILDIHGPACPCGLQGCFEAFCGGSALAKKMQEEIHTQKIKTQILKEAKGDLKAIDAKALLEAAKKKDPYALKVWKSYITRLAQGIGTVLMNYNPEVLILGTMAIHAQDFLLTPLKKELERFAWKPNIDSCKIEPSNIGEMQSEFSGLALAIQAQNGRS